MEAYAEADYARSPVDKRSTSGYCTFLGGHLVSWRSKKQNAVTRLSVKEEFQVMAQGICGTAMVKNTTDPTIKGNEPMRLYCDNKSAINIAHNPIQHGRDKHIEIDRYFIKEKIESGLICTPYVFTVN